nr:Protein of uncharacterised function YceH [Salmonella sp. NCTC 7297]
MKYELTVTEARVDWLFAGKAGHNAGTISALRSRRGDGLQPENEPGTVMNLTEQAVQEQLDNLVKRHFLRTVSGFGNRVTKYEQRFCNSEFGDLKLSAAEVALVTTLLLRGAQTPGELRSRASRMHEYQRYGGS